MVCAFTHTPPRVGSIELPAPLRGMPQALSLPGQIIRFDSAGNQYGYSKHIHGIKSMPVAWSRLPVALTMALLDFVVEGAGMRLVVWTDHTGTDYQVRFSPDPVKWKQVGPDACQVEIRLIGDAFSDSMGDENSSALTDENGNILTW